MYRDKKILAVIPARGGSKRLPKKNIKMLGNRPLIAWTIERAKKSQLLDRIVLSSDDQEIINVAKRYGCEVPFVRPSYLASDEATSEDMLEHAIRSLGENYDYVVLLQPTSPFRSTEDIDNSVRLCIDSQAPSVQSLTNVTDNPEWMFCVNEDGTIKKVCLKITSAVKYVLNGALYVLDTEVFLQYKRIMFPQTLAYLMPRERSVDIDTGEDFEYAEYLVSRGASI